MKKKILILSLIFIFILGFTISIGSTYSQNITAWFYDIKIYMDGKQWTFTNAPFIYNGNAYISLNDLARNMGLSIQWDSQSNTYSLASIDGNLSLSALKYKLDRQNLEINNLRFQLAQKEAELAMLKSSTSSRKTYRNDDDLLDDLEDLLEDKYDRYDDDEDLYFKDYRLYQDSNDDIIVKMYGRFDRNSDDWKDRDKSDFREFIEDICREIDRKFNEDIEVIVYDRDDDRIARYIWDDSDNELEKKYEYYR
ncbi:Copper amine oxidase N-terminal domain-containing protein [Caminicella sporogenes DSM 14501]|uniref:Copper amine oxidase N-terminal domain-containing protein n=1 Tax=Caminicella sporogenes DSM 14501 TaxID=1121266 RepID=A0A1M6PR91_9FIRM|nr:stalk domain-containing protein [Caminicella sporogenes]RKD22007.1 hypothetical protein BET04_07085 [Caminicella sporogenes]SHK10463.1 Copper amine oxidase N-terminal domain-containing protein [Caminicella sporogenes DSM 14501]